MNEKCRYKQGTIFSIPIGKAQTNYKRNMPDNCWDNLNLFTEQVQKVGSTPTCLPLIGTVTVDNDSSPDTASIYLRKDQSVAAVDMKLKCSNHVTLGECILQPTEVCLKDPDADAGNWSCSAPVGGIIDGFEHLSEKAVDAGPEFFDWIKRIRIDQDGSVTTDV